MTLCMVHKALHPLDNNMNGHGGLDHRGDHHRSLGGTFSAEANALQALQDTLPHLGLGNIKTHPKPPRPI